MTQARQVLYLRFPPSLIARLNEACSEKEISRNELCFIIVSEWLNDMDRRLTDWESEVTRPRNGTALKQSEGRVEITNQGFEAAQRG